METSELSGFNSLLNLTIISFCCSRFHSAFNSVFTNGKGQRLIKSPQQPNRARMADGGKGHRVRRKKPHSETTLPQTSGSLSIGKTTIFGICKSERRVRIGYCNEKTRRTTTNRSLRLMLALRSAGACQNLFLEQRERPTDSCTLYCKRSRLRHRCRGAWTIHLGEQSLMSFCNACR